MRKNWAASNLSRGLNDSHWNALFPKSHPVNCEPEPTWSHCYEIRRRGSGQGRRKERQSNDQIEKTCQHSAMKHSKQNKRAPRTHPSALAVPSYHRILVKHGLIEDTLSIPDAYEVFLKVGADPEVQKLRRTVARGNKMKHVPALHLATAMALQGMTKLELEALKLRIKEKRV